MQNKENTNVERIIAKIDNDFNPDNSDWIPRVGVWCIDAMSQLDVLRTKRVRKKLAVRDRIAYSQCFIDSSNIKVYDENGCEIKLNNRCKDCNNSPSTGEYASETSITVSSLTPKTIDLVNTGNKETANHVIVNTVNDKYPYRYNVKHYKLGIDETEHNYVQIDNNKIELNYDTEFIYVETEVVETFHSELFGCDVPVIPNNGLLIEAIAYYCMYKMLCRGYNHPVFNLKASQYGTNPYYEWIRLKEEAKRSVINGWNEDIDSKIFRSNLFIEMFDPRS